MGPRAKLRAVPATVRDPPPAPGGVCAPAESDSRAGGPQEGGAVRAAPAAGNPNTDTNLGLVGKIPGAFARIGKETNIPTGTFYPRAASRPGRRRVGAISRPGGLLCARTPAPGGVKSECLPAHTRPRGLKIDENSRKLTKIGGN